jgi:hypothetical protein
MIQAGEEERRRSVRDDGRCGVRSLSSASRGRSRRVRVGAAGEAATPTACAYSPCSFVIRVGHRLRLAALIAVAFLPVVGCVCALWVAAVRREEGGVL